MSINAETRETTLVEQKTEHTVRPLRGVPGARDQHVTDAVRTSQSVSGENLKNFVGGMFSPEELNFSSFEQVHELPRSFNRYQEEVWEFEKGSFYGDKKGVPSKKVVRPAAKRAPLVASPKIAQSKSVVSDVEAIRVAAFRASRDRVLEINDIPMSRVWPSSSSGSDTECVSPSDTLSPKRKKAIVDRKDKPRNKRIKFEKQCENVNFNVTKEDASAPVVIKMSQPSVDVPVEADPAAVEFSTYLFPKLAFVGLWNDSHSAGEYNHAKHWGVHIEQGDRISVSIYPGLVEELGCYLACRVHDDKFANYAVCQAKALSMCRSSSWIMTPEQRLTSVMYAPAIAYMTYWNDMQNISRVVTQRHVNFSLWKCLLTVACGVAAVAVMTGKANPSSVCPPLVLRGNFLEKASQRFWHLSRAIVSFAPCVVRKTASFRPSFGSGRIAAGVVAAGAMRLVGAPTAPGAAVTTITDPVRAVTNLLMGMARERSSNFSGRYNTEISKPKAKVQRPQGKAVVGEPGPFVKVDSPEAVRPRVEQVGPADPSYRPRVFENNLANQMAAVQARVLNETQKPDADFVADYIRFVKNNADELFGPAVKIEPLSFDEYIRNSNASPSVKAKLKRAHAVLEADGIDADSDVGAQAHSWSTRVAFVKEEFTNHRTPYGVTDKAPRLIQGAKPEFICLVGPFIAALQGRIKKVWNSKAAICFASGVDASTLANRLNFDDTIFEDDVSAFDASFIAELLELEVWIAQRFHAPLAVRQLMAANCNCHGVTSHGIKYCRDGCRCSGDPYTSLFNSVQNGLMHLFIYIRARNVSVKVGLKELVMNVSGDDNIGSHPGPPVDWASGMAKMGFEAVPVYREAPYLAEFCSMRLTPVEGGWTFVPKVGKVINKIAYCLDRPANLSKESLVRGTAMSLYSLASPCPPLVAFLDRLIELTDGHVAHKPAYEPWKLTGSPSSCSNETWLQLADIYSWDLEKQAVWVDVLSKSSLESTLCHPYLDLLLDADTDGPTTATGSSVDDVTSGDASIRSSCASEALSSMSHQVHGDQFAPVAEVPVGDWSISSKTRNRLAHASNGNPTLSEAMGSFFKSSQAIYDVRAFLRLGVRFLDQGGESRSYSWLSFGWGDDLILLTTSCNDVDVTFLIADKLCDGVDQIYHDSYITKDFSCNSDLSRLSELYPSYVTSEVMAVHSVIACYISKWDAIHTGVVTKAGRVAAESIFDIIDYRSDPLVNGEFVINGVLTDLGPSASWVLDTLLPESATQPEFASAGWSDFIQSDYTGYDWSLSSVERNRLAHALNGNTSSSVTREEKILSKLGDKIGLTDAAVEWLKTALDPFHDTALNCTGYVDCEMGSSVVQTVKSSVTIACPAGITTGTWDCHIQMEPFFCQFGHTFEFCQY